MLIRKLYGLFLALFFIWFLLPGLVFAEAKEITAIGEYNMSESETLLVAKERAVYIAMKNATEQAGVYVESYSQVANKQLTKDEITMISSSIIEIADKKFERKMSDTGGDFIKATITCKVSTDTIEAMIAKLNDKVTVETLQKIQVDYNNAMKEIQELKQKLANTQTAQEQSQVEEKIMQNEQCFTAVQWFERGYDYQINKKDYKGAIAAYTQSISLNPNNAYAYNNRGAAYQNQGQYDVAIADYNRAIALAPYYVNAYNNRGTAYQNKGRYDVAIADYSQAIAADPNYVTSYYNRGAAYQQKGQYALALEDYNKAIEVDPRCAYAYYNKGNTLCVLGKKQEAIEAFTQFLRYASPGDIWIAKAKQRIQEVGGQL